MQPVIDKLIHLSADRVERLGQLASASGTTEDILIEKALDLLFEFSHQEADSERRDWSAISFPSLQRVWDNEADAVYDNWRELYGVQQG